MIAGGKILVKNMTGMKLVIGRIYIAKLVNPTMKENITYVMATIKSLNILDLNKFMQQ